MNLTGHFHAAVSGHKTKTLSMSVRQRDAGELFFICGLLIEW